MLWLAGLMLPSRTSLAALLLLLVRLAAHVQPWEPDEPIVVPPFTLFDISPKWAPVAAPTQVTIIGNNFFPSGHVDPEYWCTFGDKEPVPARRVSITELVCNSGKYRPADVEVKVSQVTQIPRHYATSLPFRYLELPAVYRVEAVRDSDWKGYMENSIVFARRQGQTLRIYGKHFTSLYRFNQKHASHGNVTGLVQCQFGETLWSARSQADLLTDDDGVECEVPYFGEGSWSLWLIIGGRYEVLVLTSLRAINFPVNASSPPQVFPSPTRMCSSSGIGPEEGRPLDLSHALLQLQCLTEDLNQSWATSPTTSSDSLVVCNVTVLVLDPHTGDVRLIAASALPSWPTNTVVYYNADCIRENRTDSRLLLYNEEEEEDEGSDRYANGTMDLGGNESEAVVDSARVLSVSPTWGWASGGTMVRVHGEGLPTTLVNSYGELAVRCDFGEAGIVDAISTNPTFVECVAPTTREAAFMVTVAVILGFPPNKHLSHADARFTFLQRLDLHHITPILGYTSGGTNVTITFTAPVLPMWNLVLDCAFGHNRVRARLLSINNVSDSTLREYSMQCMTPPASHLPRMTEEGCACKPRWFIPSGIRCDHQCCALEPGGRPACYVEDKWCQGADWGYCNATEDTMAAGIYTACVRMLPSVAHIVTEPMPCQHRFVYVTSPVVDTIHPASGPISGGTNVSIHGRYFIKTTKDMLCRFDTFITPARWLGQELLSCFAPAAFGNGSLVITVPVTISTDGGYQWAVTFASFTFVPLTQGLISPDFGPQAGGTTIDVFLVSSTPEAEVVTWPTDCCFNDPPLVRVPALRLSDTHLQCITPPWTRPSATVRVGLSQADGTCHPLPQTEYTYVDMWRISDIFPSVIMNEELHKGGIVDVLVSGENLRPNGRAMCTFDNESVSATVLESRDGLLCRLPQLRLFGPTPVDGRTVEVKVTMNGVDFAERDPPLLLRINPVFRERVGPDAPEDPLQNCTPDGDEDPEGPNVSNTSDVFLAGPKFGLPRAPRANIVNATPLVVEVTPSFGSITGGVIVQLIGSHFVNSAWLSCKFDEIEVRAIRFISDRQILCQTPPHRAGMVQVTVANDGVNFAPNNYAFFTYADLSQPCNITPHLGPKSGNTTVTVSVLDIPSPARNMLRCFFGTIRVIGRYLSRTTFQCTSPEMANPGAVRFTITLNGQDRSEATQEFLFYESPNVTQVDPELGPSEGALNLRLFGQGFISTQFLAVRMGGLSVAPTGVEYSPDSITSPEINGGVYIVLPTVFISDRELSVTLPELTDQNHMERVPIFVTNNGQNWSPEGVQLWDEDDDSHDEPRSLQYFTFHDEVKPELAEPEYGMVYGNGFINLYGWGFKNTSGLKCSFAWVESPSTIYLSSSHILCEVPNMLDAHSSKSLGNAELRVTLNGKDWSDSYVDFRFLGVCPIGHYCRHDESGHYTFRVLPCPAGHYCESVGMSFPSPCGPGTFQAYRRQVQCQQCPTGFYCPRGRTIEPLPCERGWVCDEIGLINPVKRCPAGHYCGEGVATRTARLTLRMEGQKPRVCPPGLACFEGAVAPNSKPHNYSTPQPCMQGYFCPPASATPYGAGACPLGKFCPTPRHTGLLCPARYMCGTGLANVEPIPCPEGTFNPWLGQWNCTLCMQGGVCPRSRLRLPIACPCGFECSERGLTRAWKLCPAGLMCDEGVATTIEPKLCRPITFGNTIDLSIPRNRDSLCDGDVGEHFVFVSRLLQVPEIAAEMGYDENTPLQSGFAACCWTAEKLESYFLSLSSTYYSEGNSLSGRTFARLAELLHQWTLASRAVELSNPGFDGLTMLNVTEEEWRDTWLVRWPPARADLLRLKEKMYVWTRPLPCQAGSYCTEGTCPRYLQTGVVHVDYTSDSEADGGATVLRRRLQQRPLTTGAGVIQINCTINCTLNSSTIDFVVATLERMLEQKRRAMGEAQADSWNGSSLALRKTLTERLLTVVQEGFPLNNPLALRSPKQCVAGTFCNQRASSSDGTGFCPAGFSCMPGAAEPQQAPEGISVPEAGRVRGVECFPGQFAPFPNTAECFPCPAGYSCPSFGTTVPYVCPPGTYRTPLSSNTATTIACRPCGQGRWSPWRGAMDVAACEPCPRGRVCPLNTGNVTETTVCPGGYMCAETTGNATEAQVCPDGFFCGPGTDPSSVYEFLCPAGFYCGIKTSEANKYKFRCPLGFYCPSGTGFKSDLQRPLVQRSVYMEKVYFYQMQKLAQYCTRLKMYALQLQIFQEKAILAERGLPPMEAAGERLVVSQWFTEFTRDRVCQFEAVDAVIELYGIAAEVADMQGREFLADVLLQPTLSLPVDYSNKCYQYNPEVGGLGWPDPCDDEEDAGAGANTEPCSPLSQLECLCTASTTKDMLQCFGTGIANATFPDPNCVSSQSQPSSFESWCMDWTLQVDVDIGAAVRRRRQVPRDEFDLMAVHYLTYVQASVRNELHAMASRGQSSQVRCPFATMTNDENRENLYDCVPRNVASPLPGEGQQVVVNRVNPLDAHDATLNLSSTSGDPAIEESYRPVFAAPAGSSFLITFDVRHIAFGYPSTLRYGTDWRIKILLNDTLRPEYNDPVECSSLLQESQLGSRSEIELTARQSGCVEVTLPAQFQAVWDEQWNAVEAARAAGTTVDTMFEEERSVFTFALYPLVDSEWRMEVQITNGLYQPDHFMFIHSARVEMVVPRRAEVGTTKAFAIEMQYNNYLKVELPYNMPLKNFPGNDGDQEQRILQKAFIGWLPYKGTLTNSMRHPTVDGEYFFQTKGDYFQNRNQELLLHLPYFSNCRGFGRATPFWQLVEQSNGCTWKDNPEEVTLLSLGATAQGDKCNPAQVECILDEPPNFPMPSDRWFEAKTGSVIFHVTVDPILGSELDQKSQEPQAVVPVYLMKGIRESGHLPRGVVLVFQYWQKTSTKKEMVKVRAYYTNAEQPAVEFLRDRNTEPWTYTLTVLYFPMTHYEVMVSFAFPPDFYFVLFTAMGLLVLGMTLLLWVYHRLLCRLTFRPRLFNSKYVRYILPPVVKGGLFALIPCLPALGFGMALIRGRVLGLTMPFAQCADPDVIQDNCMMGLLDHVMSSYGGETSVSATNMQTRRTGRTGTVLVVMGAYVVITSLKLIVPRTDSAFYAREDVKQARASADDDRSESDESIEQQAPPYREDSDSMEPVFTTYLWKRSCLALVVFVNAIFMNVAIQFSYSNLYTNNILICIIIEYSIFKLLQLGLTNFMCEVYLIVPINNIHQITILVTLLAATSVFDFLMCYVALNGLQMIDRVYISANEDWVMAQFATAWRRCQGYVRWVVKQTAVGKESIVLNDPDDEPVEDQQVPGQMVMGGGGAQTDGQTEDMIGFLTDLSTGMVGDTSIPFCYILFWFLYDESQILESYEITIETTMYYVFFYCVMIIFQYLTNFVTINIAELYHGWHVTDYLEYCGYRFRARAQGWKGRGASYDETLPPHMRSVDQMCFSEQYYFVLFFHTAGVMCWILGLQIILVNHWNVFDDPASALILIGTVAICKGAHIMTLISASYLKVWVIFDGQARVRKPMADIIKDTPQVSHDGTTGEAPPPPRGSMLEGWPVPSPRDTLGLERYRQAFLKENRLWLQSAFSELDDKNMMIQHREALLKSLTDLLRELSMEDYGPGNDTPGLEFGAEPVAPLARAAGEWDRLRYQGSLTQELLRIWRARAVFMLRLAKFSATLKIDADKQERRRSCELCGRVENLRVVPIYTLTHLASTYREQRDMSPLWNMPLWRHFYQTFTPLCTLCEACQEKHHIRNENIPVDEKRFQRLRERQKTAHELVQESRYQPVPISGDTAKLLELWLKWTQHLGRGELPRDFLPRYGFEGRTMAEIRRERLLEEEEEAEPIAAAAAVLSDDDDDEAAPQAAAAIARAKTLSRLSQAQEAREDLESRPTQDLDMESSEGEDPAQQFAGAAVDITWSSRVLAVTWLHRARENLSAPQLHHWDQHGTGQQQQQYGSPPASRDATSTRPQLRTADLQPQQQPGRAPFSPQPRGGASRQ